MILRMHPWIIHKYFDHLNVDYRRNGICHLIDLHLIGDLMQFISFSWMQPNEGTKASKLTRADWGFKKTSLSPHHCRAEASNGGTAGLTQPVSSAENSELDCGCPSASKTIPYTFVSQPRLSSLSP